MSSAIMRQRFRVGRPTAPPLVCDDLGQIEIGVLLRGRAVSAFVRRMLDDELSLQHFCYCVTAITR
jgi:hypothetical protein